MTAKPHAFLFFLILAVGVFLRFHALDRQSLWQDEMSTLRTISMPVRHVMVRFKNDEPHPPLYFLQLKLWRALRWRSLVRLRANSACWGCLSLALVYLVGSLYGGESLGLLAMAFLALSPFHLAYSQELRPYAMAVAISLAALLALERRSWFFLVCLWTAQLYTHYWGSFVVLSQALYGIWNAPSRSVRTAVALAFLAASGAFVLWLPILAAQMDLINHLASPATAFSAANLAKVFLAYSGLVFNMASSVFYLPSIVWVLALIGLLFAAGLAIGLRRGPRAAVAWLGVGLGIPWLLSYWKPEVFLWYRYPVHMLPAFALLVAWGWLAVRPAALRIAMILVCLGSQAWGDWIFFHDWQKANPKAVVQYVHHLRRPNSIVVRPSHFGDLFNFYDEGTTTSIDQDVFDSPAKRAALEGRSVILLAFDVPSDPVADGFLREFNPQSARYFPGTSHLGITVYELR